MNDDDVVIIETRPVNQSENLLRQKFADAIAEQSALMDKLAQQLVALNLAIPGLYVSVLTLTQGSAGIVAVDRWLIAALGCWLGALVCALFALVPQDYSVDPNMLKSDPTGKSKKLSIEEFFRKSAVYKRRLLIPSAVLSFVGIVCAAFVFLRVP